MRSFIKIDLTVSEEMSFKATVDDARRTIHDERRTPNKDRLQQFTLCSGELTKHDTH